MNIQPRVMIDLNMHKYRAKLYSIITSKTYDIFSSCLTLLNTISLGINWYSQTVRVDNILDDVNYSFALFFFIEAFTKMAVFGWRPYFRDSGNTFDFIVVLSSLVSSIVSIVLNIDFGSSTTFIRAMRISRVFKYIKEAKQIKIIFETVIVTIPALTNIGGLLLLFLYIFSVLGIFLFSGLKLQNNLDEHANFQSFTKAFLTLLRCSTGESWDYIMSDTMRQRSILFQCSEDSFDYDQYVANGMQT
jgi:Ion transport protein